MPAATELFLIKRASGFQPRDDYTYIPKRTRGVYVLYQNDGDTYRVVYVGMAGGPKAGMAGRIKEHFKKKKDWSHFTIMEVHDNIGEPLVRELEGIVRHIPRGDRSAHVHNRQWRFLKLKHASSDLKKWPDARKQKS